jgi:RNA polymerase sigma-70 factor (ECF subfamily)
LPQRDQELIAHAMRGDAEAFGRLVDPHLPSLHRSAVAMLARDRASDAEDVVQDTMLAAFRGLSGFKGRSSFRTWLVAILVQQVALARRKTLRWSFSQPETEPAGNDDFVRRADARMDVMEMLNWLTPEHREVLVLRELEQMSYDEIAGVLNVPAGTVESRLFRARQELRKRLSETTP